MSAILRGMFAAACFLLPAVFCNAQTKPIITGPLSQGQVTVTGTAQNNIAPYAGGVTIGLCVSANKPAASAGACAPAEPLAGTPPPANPQGVIGGTFSLTLANPLVAGKWVYAVQAAVTTDAGGTATTLYSYSDPVQIAPLTTPVIGSSTTPPVNAVSGTGQAKVAAYRAVKVSVCFSANTADVGTDCTKTSTMLAMVDPGGGAVATAFTLVRDGGSFSATLKTSIPSGNSIWLWEVATVAATPPVDDVAVSSVGGLASAAPFRPTIQQPLKDGGGFVSGTAMNSPTTGEKVKVQLCSKKALDAQQCDPISAQVDVGMDGTFSITHNLREGEFLMVKQTSTNPAAVIPPDFIESTEVTVGVQDNERVYIDFIAGVLLSQQQAAFSQTNIFLALNVDDTFYRPGWYSQFENACTSVPVKDKSGHDTDKKKLIHAKLGDTGAVACSQRHTPGVNGFFQVRLTAIPVNSVQTTTPASSSPPTTTDAFDTFLVTRKAAHFEMGTYLPFYFGRTHLPTSALRQAFFIAPIARFGFNTLVADDGGTNSNNAATGAGTTTTVSTTPVGASDPNTSVYSFGVAGLRIGTADLKNGSPHIVHYVDFSMGKFSNLRDLYCAQQDTPAMTSGSPPVTTPIVPGCSTAGTTIINPSLENHRTSFRVQVEGYLDIEGFILGFSVNKSQNYNFFNGNKDLVKSGVITPAKDDVRFLLGYRIDVNKLLAAVKRSGGLQ